MDKASTTTERRSSPSTMTMQMADFQFAFDPLLFPEPPSVPPSSELFSASETSNLIGFLDNFTDWDFSGDVSAFDTNTASNVHGLQPFQSDAHDQHSHRQHIQRQHALDSLMGGAFSDHMPPPPDSASSSTSPRSVDLSALRTHPYPQPYSPRSSSSTSHSGYSVGRARKPSTSSNSTAQTPSATAGPSRPARPLLDDKQKRMNHIMSEQKRRNAIRDGYAQLTALLAPAGAPPGTGMPTRGRPKGSGTKGKSRPGAGKSGVLLRAVEYCRWLEEGRDALLTEVQRLEAAAGIRVDL